MKRCAMCKELLPVTEFHKNKARKDGLDTRCKECSKLHRKQQYHKDPEKEKAKSDAFRRAHPELYREYARKRADTDEWREYMRTYKATWLKTDKGRIYNQSKRRRRRATEMNAAGAATKEQVQARIDYYGGRCWICDAPYQAIDHVIPLSKGGTDYPANLRPICTSCNSRKNDKHPLQD
jgi:5-methylcytosine-specific restriction endonuclease McrA